MFRDFSLTWLVRLLSKFPSWTFYIGLAPVFSQGRPHKEKVPIASLTKFQPLSVRRDRSPMLPITAIQAPPADLAHIKRCTVPFTMCRHGEQHRRSASSPLSPHRTDEARLFFSALD